MQLTQKIEKSPSISLGDVGIDSKAQVIWVFVKGEPVCIGLQLPPWARKLSLGQNDELANTKGLRVVDNV